MEETVNPSSLKVIGITAYAASGKPGTVPTGNECFRGSGSSMSVNVRDGAKTSKSVIFIGENGHRPLSFAGWFFRTVALGIGIVAALMLIVNGIS